MATPWRFENNKGGGNTLKKAQDERIETEKNLLQKNNDQLKIDASAFKITWAERFDEVNDRCRAKILSHTDKEELKLVRKANMMVNSFIPGPVLSEFPFILVSHFSS